MNRRQRQQQRPDRYSTRRAAVLALVYLLMTIHILHWKLAGRTLAPLELNEVMYTLELGIMTAGFIFMAAAVLATAIFGRFFCSWGCHILALEDLCAWLLAKLKIRPKPVRSRTLLCVPMVAMLYMFAWPQASRLASGQEAPAQHIRTDSQGWASFVTTNFWRNLPGPGITLLTFAVCGFAVVYFLGSRAFCTYGCPYGAVFSLVDRIAPGRIVARGDCAQCGICTAACQSRVRVHEEVVKFGRIVNPACLKDLDCIAVCPNDALAFGFAKPAVLERHKSSRMPPKPYDFTLAEDLLIALVFLATLFIYRGLYEKVPFLLTLALGGILGYVAVLGVRLARLRHVKLNNFQLKIGGRLTRTGRVFIGTAVWLALFTIHSAMIRYHEFRGERLFNLAQAESPAGATAAAALGHLEFCRQWGLFQPEEERHHATVLHESIAAAKTDQGDFPTAIHHLREACLAQPNSAFLHYNLGVLFAQTGRKSDALCEYQVAAALDPTDPEIQNNLGYLIADQGDFTAAAAHFRTAIELRPNFAHPHFNLGRVLIAQGRREEAEQHFRTAAKLDSNYAQLLAQHRSSAEPPQTTGPAPQVQKGTP